MTKSPEEIAKDVWFRILDGIDGLEEGQVLAWQVNPEESIASVIGAEREAREKAERKLAEKNDPTTISLDVKTLQELCNESVTLEQELSALREKLKEEQSKSSSIDWRKTAELLWSEIFRLREVLKPFAKAAEVMNMKHPESTYIWAQNSNFGEPIRISVADCVRAKAALSETEGKR